MKKKRAVSEVVAALLLLVVTVGVFGIFYAYYVNGLSSSSTSVSQEIQNSNKATGELMSLVSYQVQDNTITLYLYNYGLQPITLNPPQEAFLISGSQQQQAQNFDLSDATSNKPINTIQTQELAQLSLTFNNIPSSGSFYVEIIDSIGKNFEFQLSAG